MGHTAAVCRSGLFVGNNDRSWMPAFRSQSTMVILK
jgi:hypothetical protein